MGSVRDKIIAQIRAAKRGVENAVEKGVESANDSIQRVQADIEGYPQKQAVAIALSQKKKSKKQSPKQKRKKVQKKALGGAIKKISPISRPQRFKGIL